MIKKAIWSELRFLLGLCKMIKGIPALEDDILNSYTVSDQRLFKAYHCIRKKLNEECWNKRSIDERQEMLYELSEEIWKLEV